LICDALSITNDRRLCLRRFYTFHAAVGEFELAAVLHVLHPEDYSGRGQLPIAQVLPRDSRRIPWGKVCRSCWPGWIHPITFLRLLVVDKHPTWILDFSVRELLYSRALHALSVHQAVWLRLIVRW